MTKVKFDHFFDYEDERMARLNVFADDLEIPVNISVGDATIQYFETGEICNAFLWSDEYEVSIYEDDKARKEAGESMAAISMIPMGTFPADQDWDNFVQNGFVIFSGIVTDVRPNHTDDEEAPSCFVNIHSYGFDFTLHYFGDEKIEKDYIIAGRIWLYGDLYKAEC